MRLLITNNNNDLFIQGEYVSNAGSHTRRLTEDLPPAIKAHALALIEWADAEETKTYVPLIENYEDGRRLEQEIGRLQARLAQVKAR